ncbi:MAG: TnsA-like heteromeric transposase endonuclease subunit [Actinomycetes bacterium]
MQPVREPIRSARQRHIAALAFSQTTDSFHLLESGLEHDLFRMLDRDPEVEWIVAQPLELAVTGDENFRHIPDLLVLNRAGQVTVWDARPEARRDARFNRATAATAKACSKVGWNYATFAGISTVQRLNELWLHCSRVAPSWLGTFEGEILEAVAGGPSTLGALFDLAGGDPRSKACVWHLIWRGDLCVDLSAQIQESTMVARVSHDA